MFGRRAMREFSSRGLGAALLVVAGLLGLPTRTAAQWNEHSRDCHIRQAVTAPAPAPIQRPPRFENGPVATGVESFTSTWTKAARSLEGRGLDLYGAREQLGGYLVFSFQRWLSLGASFEVTIPGSEDRILPGPLGQPSGASGGGGLQVGFHFRLSRRVRLDWVSDLWLYRLRYRMSYQDSTGVLWQSQPYSICPPPNPPQASVYDDTTHVFLFRSQLSLGVDLGRLRLLAALGLRNVPHHITGDSAPWSDRYTEPREVHTFYPYLWIGLALPLGSGVSATVGLVQPLWANPMGYAPGLGIGLHFESDEPLEGRR